MMAVDQDDIYKPSAVSVWMDRQTGVLLEQI